MSVDEITFDDLLDDEPSNAGPITTMRQLRDTGFPPQGGLKALAAVQQLEDPDGELAALRQCYLQFLDIQKRTG